MARETGINCKCVFWAIDGADQMSYVHHPNCEHYDPLVEAMDLISLLYEKYAVLQWELYNEEDEHLKRISLNTIKGLMKLSIEK